MNKKALIIFGATGALAHDKIFPSLKSFFDKESSIVSNLEVVGYGRKDLGNKHEGFSYIKGDLETLSLLSQYLLNKNISEIYSYVSLPPDLYLQTIKSIVSTFSNTKFRIALEKPFGSNSKEALTLSNIVKKYGNQNFYLIDHFLAKQSVINFSEIPKEYKDVKSIKQIEIALLEEEGVEGRGEFYDDLGAIKEVGQNHLLNTLVAFLNPEDKKIFLNKLIYIPNSLIVGQYEGYTKTTGVKENSKTETYFKTEFKYKNIKVIFRSGKELKENKTYLKIYYNDGSDLYIEVKPKLLQVQTKN